MKGGPLPFLLDRIESLLHDTHVINYGFVIYKPRGEIRIRRHLYS